MNFFNLATHFMTWGKMIEPRNYLKFKAYFSEMLKRNRVMVVTGDNGIECLICYFLTDELDTFINRPMWSCPKDNEQGHIFFIDKMVAHKWTPSLRKLVQKQVEEKFPHVNRGFWLREPFNRSVIISKRGLHELQR